MPENIFSNAVIVAIIMDKKQKKYLSGKERWRGVILIME
jgi:hypothetical protein